MLYDYLFSFVIVDCAIPVVVAILVVDFGGERWLGMGGEVGWLVIADYRFLMDGVPVGY